VYPFRRSAHNYNIRMIWRRSLF